MGVVIETCTKYPGGRTRIAVTDVSSAAAWRGEIGINITAIPQRTQVSVRV
jgi:hypothetical protein